MPTLLLADDSVAIQRLVALMFAHEKIDVTTVGDGEDAIARIAADPPDVVLADIGMPRRSGYDVAAFVKQQPALCRIPVLLLASAFEPVDEARAAQVHCDGVLIKPFEAQQVISRVRELLGGAAGMPARAASAAPRAVDRLTNLKLVGPPVPQRATAPPPSLPVMEPPSPRTHALAPPGLGAEPASSDDMLENYFDRLDAAFATLDSGLQMPSRRDEIEPLEPFGRDEELDLRSPIDLSLDQPLDEPNVDVPTVDRLLAGEQDETVDPAARLDVAVPQPVVTDALIEEVTRRVLERLSSEALRPIVADVVSHVAERLVREEIDRIRKQT